MPQTALKLALPPRKPRARSPRNSAWRWSTAVRESKRHSLKCPLRNYLTVCHVLAQSLRVENCVSFSFSRTGVSKLPLKDPVVNILAFY